MKKFFSILLLAMIVLGASNAMAQRKATAKTAKHKTTTTQKSASSASVDFFSAQEILNICKRGHTGDDLRAFCKEYGMSLLYEKEYNQPSDYEGQEDDHHLDLAGGKDCEVVWTTNEYGQKKFSLKATSRNACGIIITAYYNLGWDESDGYALDEQGYSFVQFAFPSKASRARVISQLRAKKGVRVITSQKNGLYWLSIIEEDVI